MDTVETADQIFRQLVGEWQGNTKTWWEPGAEAVETETRGTFRFLEGSRFLIHEYTGSAEGKPHHGIIIFGFNSASGGYESAWVDGFHMSTNIMFSKGEGVENGFSVLGSYPVPHTDWGWRTEITIQNPDQITLRMFNIPPGEEEVPGIETVYTKNRK